VGYKLKKKIIFTSIVIILILGISWVYYPRKIVSENDHFIGFKVNYHNSIIKVNQNKIIKILGKYRAITTFVDYFPYEANKIDYEIDFIKNSKSIHILLGEFNIWYDSRNGISHNILHARQLKQDLLKEFNLEK
jgi:hypothetical protein